MKNLEDHKKIAILIDADNTQCKKLKVILEELNAHGHVITKRAYGDWSSEYLKNWKSSLNELAIQPIQQFSYTSGKNATDASMIIDAMDLLYSKKYDAFALVSSDSDFTRLAARIREEELFVFGVGGQKTPLAFRNACDDFIFIENLKGDEPAAAGPAAADAGRLLAGRGAAVRRHLPVPVPQLHGAHGARGAAVHGAHPDLRDPPRRDRKSVV